LIGDVALRVYPSAVVDAAGTARTAARAALDLGGGLRSLAQVPGFLPRAQAAFDECVAVWVAELDRIAVAVADVADRAEQAADDYVATDSAAGARLVSAGGSG
jgi:hypothetical protein